MMVNEGGESRLCVDREQVPSGAGGAQWEKECTHKLPKLKGNMSQADKVGSPR